MVTEQTAGVLSKLAQSQTLLNPALPPVSACTLAQLAAPCILTSESQVLLNVARSLGDEENGRMSIPL